MGRNGFTLVEITVALVILTVGILPGPSKEIHVHPP